MQTVAMIQSAYKPCMCTMQRANAPPNGSHLVQLPRPGHALTRTAQRDAVKAQSFFSKLRQDSASAGVYGSQGRDEYSEEDVADYFAYIGLLAVEGNYDSMDAIIASGMHPADILLVFASKENDTPKVEELLRAGADVNIKDLEGRSPLELCTKPEIKELLKNAGAQ